MSDDFFGGVLTDAPNKNYEKFFSKFIEIDTLPVEKWKPVHLIAFFTRKYFEQYKVKYKFKFNSQAPSKCFEVFQIKKLASMLSSDPEILKDYIDWVYETRVIKAKRRLTSISFMTVEGIVNEYKFKVLLAQPDNKIDRTTPLPDKYKNIFVDKGFDVSTYGDVAFLYNVPNKTKEMISAFDMAQMLGLDLVKLSKVV